MVQWWLMLIATILALLVGAVAGFFVTRYFFNRTLEKNPPINREMIRAMYMQMGRKPSEKDITRVMEAMNQYKK
jgi:uncharacterized protein YneF (UPF0154 family)